MDKKKGPVGVLGFFEGPTELLGAVEKVRLARYRSFDAFSPFPIHGMDEAQGLKRSPLPMIAFCAGVTGFCCAFALQYWTSAVDWPLIVGGKPFNSWPAFVPVMFELTVLFTGLTTVGAMFALNRLPNVTQKIFDPGLTRDRFAVVIEAPLTEDDRDEEKDKNFRAFQEQEATEFLKKIGAREVRTVFHEGWFS